MIWELVAGYAVLLAYIGWSFVIRPLQPEPEPPTDPIIWPSVRPMSPLVTDPPYEPHLSGISMAGTMDDYKFNTLSIVSGSTVSIPSSLMPADARGAQTLPSKTVTKIKRRCLLEGWAGLCLHCGRSISEVQRNGCPEITIRGNNPDVIVLDDAAYKREFVATGIGARGKTPVTMTKGELDEILRSCRD